MIRGRSAVRRLLLSFAGIFSIIFALIAASCGDVCDRLPKLTEQRCGFEVPTSENSGEQTVCEAEAEVAARCASENKAAYCEWLEAFMDGDVEYENDYTACVEGELAG